MEVAPPGYPINFYIHFINPTQAANQKPFREECDATPFPLTSKTINIEKDAALSLLCKNLTLNNLP